MKLLAIELARAIWLGPISDFNTKGISLYHVLLPFLVDTYKFMQVPSPGNKTDPSKGLELHQGKFDVREDFPIAVNLTVYNDGFIADTFSSTQHSELFLADLFQHLSYTFNMPHYESIIKKRVYVSRVYVSTDKSMELISPKLKVISEYLSTNVEQGAMAFETGSISFWPDQINKVNPLPFSFERALNVPFSDKRYFSSAPLPTDKHLELLDLLETALE